MAKVQNDYLAGIFTGNPQTAEKINRAVDSSSIARLDAGSLKDFAYHTFQVKDDEDMQELVESIKNQGIIEPLIVRKIEDGYEIISGHRRRYAALKADMKLIPAYVVDLNDDEAVIAMVDANMRRSAILPSELAHSFKAKAEAMKHMGIKDENGTTSEQIGAEVGKSGRTVERYIRLTYLISELLEQVDNKKISIDVAVTLSFLNEDNQYSVYEICYDNGIKPSASQAQELKDNEECLTYEMITSILCKKKEKKRQIVLSEKKLDQYFPRGMSYAEREKVILDLLEKYKSNI